jgi:hypothetical protein
MTLEERETTMTPTTDPSRNAPARGRTRRQSSTARALAMLSALPVFSAPVDRVHVGPRQPGGMRAVLDRPTGEQLIVYTPRFRGQFDSGHRMGRWYVRCSRHVGCNPQSEGFITARQAIEAVRAGQWSRRFAAERRDRPVRVFWSAPAGTETRMSASGCGR